MREEIAGHETARRNSAGSTTPTARAQAATADVATIASVLLSKTANAGEVAVEATCVNAAATATAAATVSGCRRGAGLAVEPTSALSTVMASTVSYTARKATLPRSATSYVRTPISASYIWALARCKPSTLCVLRPTQISTQTKTLTSRARRSCLTTSWLRGLTALSPWTCGAWTQLLPAWRHGTGAGAVIFVSATWASSQRTTTPTSCAPRWVRPPSLFSTRPRAAGAGSSCATC